MKYLKPSLILLAILLINYNIKSSEIEIKEKVNNQTKNELSDLLLNAIEDLDLETIKSLIETKGVDISFLSNHLFRPIKPNSKLAQSSSLAGKLLINYLLPRDYNTENTTHIKLKILEYLINKGLKFDNHKPMIYNNQIVPILNYEAIQKTPSLFEVLLNKEANFNNQTLITFIINNAEKLNQSEIKKIIYLLLIKGLNICAKHNNTNFFDYLKKSNDLQQIWKEYLNYINNIKKILIEYGIPSQSVDKIIIDYGYITNKNQCTPKFEQTNLESDPSIINQLVGEYL